MAPLKLDIEGAKTQVFLDCASSLQNVERIFGEYSSIAQEPQEPPSLISLLANAGRRLHITASLVSPQPFVSGKTSYGMDSLLNLFASRDAPAAAASPGAADSTAAAAQHSVTETTTCSSSGLGLA